MGGRSQLQRAKAEAEETLRHQAIELADPEVVREYVQDLKALLEESSIVEQKAFLKSFVERIEVDDSQTKVIYTIPMPPDNPSAETVAVLPFVHNGPPLWTKRKTFSKTFALVFSLFSRHSLRMTICNFVTLEPFGRILCLLIHVMGK